MARAKTPKRSVLLLTGTTVERHVYRRAHHGPDDGFVFVRETVSFTDPCTQQTLTRKAERMKDVRRAPEGIDADYIQLEEDGSMPALTLARPAEAA